MSLRSFKSEVLYQEAKKTGKTTPLVDVQTLVDFNYWRIIPNDYPYDIAYKRCHMLIIKRQFVDSWNKLTQEEILEYNYIRYLLLYNEYDQIIENAPSRRSVPNMLHVHLVNFLDDRDEMHL